jgi:hypothetical protein
MPEAPDSTHQLGRLAGPSAVMGVAATTDPTAFARVFRAPRVLHAGPDDNPAELLACAREDARQHAATLTCEHDAVDT